MHIFSVLFWQNFFTFLKPFFHDQAQGLDCVLAKNSTFEPVCVCIVDSQKLMSFKFHPFSLLHGFHSALDLNKWSCHTMNLGCDVITSLSILNICASHSVRFRFRLLWLTHWMTVAMNMCESREKNMWLKASVWKALSSLVLCFKVIVRVYQTSMLCLKLPGNNI